MSMLSGAVPEDDPSSTDPDATPGACPMRAGTGIEEEAEAAVASVSAVPLRAAATTSAQRGTRRTNGRVRPALSRRGCGFISSYLEACGRTSVHGWDPETGNRHNCFQLPTALEQFGSSW